MTACGVQGCAETATVAIRTQRPTRNNLWTKVWWSEEEAPSVADRYCAEHAVHAITELARVLA